MSATKLVRIIIAMLALSIASPAIADDVTFSGQVVLDDRAVLPPGSALTITFVGLPGEQRITGARASLDEQSRSPIQFALNVRSKTMQAGGEYGLVAEIWSGGGVIFRSRQPILVDALAPSGITIPVQYNPTPPQAAAETEVPPIQASHPLLDILWTVTSIGGDPVLPHTKLTLSIAADHRAGGNGGCNNYFTEAGVGTRPLTFGPVAGTRMACDPAVMVQEDRFFAALDATADFELTGDALKLLDAAGVPLVGLIRAP